MNPKEVQLIKKSWKSFRLIDPLIVGDVFYTKLFYEYPPLKSMFKISLEAQSKKLIDMLNIIVGRLDRLDEMARDISELAMRHVHYGVKPQHYKAVGMALLWTLQQGLGTGWTTDTAAAWEKCFNFLADIMIRATYPETIPG